MAELAGLPLAALIFLLVIFIFLTFLILLFMYLNRIACFANCGGCPCMEEKKKKREKQAILGDSFGYENEESSSDSEDETILRYQQSLLPPKGTQPIINKKIKKSPTITVEGEEFLYVHDVEDETGDTFPRHERSFFEMEGDIEMTGVRAEDAEQGDISIGQEGHDDPVQSEMVDDLPLVGSEDDDDIVVENVQPADAGPSIGELEIAFQYNGEARRMNVTIIKCHNLPTKDEGGASSFRLRLLLLPSKRQRAKTHIRETQEPLFKELFRFSRIFPHEVVSTALRCRLYGCERMRKEKLIGESIIKFSSLNIGTKQIIKVRIDPRSDVSKDGSSPYSSTSDLSDSNSSSSLQSMSQGSVPEILIGLAYNATTGRLDVEVIKGSHFKQKAAGRAPDSFVKVALMSSSGFEISKSKTSVRRSQSSPTFKETFFFQVAQFQLPEMTLLFTAFNKKGVKRKETIGWFSMGLSNSSEEEIGHWNEMRESKGHQVCRWHALLES
ncbi:synaptotagmin-14-like isoform X3 [Lytechinus variegatus]|uniref:synaptotagmin-14-like isoform X3 n=1 Tax=Lytechinus variegatus TaxID=7654 RepID=UPI001BB22745|nr:synaptotagmin-14-like isoform X3 [Lytechinus variegatus]